MPTVSLKEYPFWDVSTRLFHWINVMAVMSLICIGLIMLYKEELGITEVSAKLGLKSVHVIIGYILVLNLIWRINWAFIGNRYARARAITPGSDFIKSLRRYVPSLVQGQPQRFIGHTPSLDLLSP